MTGDGGGRETKHVTSRQLIFFVNCRVKLLKVLYTLCHKQGIW
jgi:hypothetical protein